MDYPIPRFGNDPAALVDSASYHTDLLLMLSAFKKGEFTRPESASLVDPTIWITNESGGNADEGTLLQITGMASPRATNADAFFRSPVMSASSPVWHSAIDNLFVLNRPAVNDGSMPYHLRQWAVVAVTSTTAGDRYVMIDPADPTKMKTSDAGIFKVLGVDTTNNMAVVDLTQSQPLWRFELTESAQAHPMTTSAKLVRLDGVEFAPTIALTDPTGLLESTSAASGAIGQCKHVGNKFYPIDVECG